MSPMVIPSTPAMASTEPGTPAVVTVGSIHGGTKHNIIPDEVKLQLTLRSFDDAVADHRAAAGRPAQAQMAAFLPAGLALARLRRWPELADRRSALAPLTLAARVVLRRP